MCGEDKFREQDTEKLTAKVVMEMIPSPNEPTVTLPVTLAWDETEPFEVTMTHDGPHVSVTWSVGRDLLQTASYANRSGAWSQGDVRITRISTAMWFHLDSFLGRRSVQCDSRKVAAFVQDAFAVCPHGEERLDVDVDTAIQQIFNGGMPARKNERKTS